MEIFNWLSNNEFITDYKILEYWTKTDESYIKLKINFVDYSELHVREHLDSELKTYSYHWQDSEKILIIRWDNAPHHADISSFPHHVHEGSEENVKESYDITISEVMKYIFNKIKGKD